MQHTIIKECGYLCNKILLYNILHKSRLLTKLLGISIKLWGFVAIPLLKDTIIYVTRFYFITSLLSLLLGISIKFWGFDAIYH